MATADEAKEIQKSNWKWVDIFILLLLLKTYEIRKYKSMLEQLFSVML